jgi:hypothetical protein
MSGRSKTIIGLLLIFLGALIGPRISFSSDLFQIFFFGAMVMFALILGGMFIAAKGMSELK